MNLLWALKEPKITQTSRRLRGGSDPARHGNAREIAKRHQLKPILFGILCTSSYWKHSLRKNLENVLIKLKENERIDIGCCIEAEAFDVQYDNGKLKLIESHVDDALLFFFFKLFDRLQQLGNVPALDTDEYLKTLKIQSSR